MANPYPKGFLDKYARLITPFYRPAYSARRRDYERICETEGSFIIYSPSRNGITTLLEQYERENRAFFHTCGIGSFESQKNVIDSSTASTIILDDTSLLFEKELHEEMLDYLEEQSKKRKVGLRFHPTFTQYINHLSERGYEVLKIGQIPLDEFQALIKELLPDEYPRLEPATEHAVDKYASMFPSMVFVGEVFKEMLINPSIDYSKFVNQQTFNWRSLEKEEIANATGWIE